MKTIPTTLHGSVEQRARKMAGWSGRLPYNKEGNPEIYRILRRRGNAFCGISIRK